MFFDEVAVKLEWEGSAKLRSEFFGDFETYKAYAKAESQGLIRSVQKSNGLHKETSPGKPARMAAPPLFVNSDIEVKRTVPKSKAGKALRQIRDRAVEIQDRKGIDFGDALPLAEGELPELVAVLDQYQIETGELIFGRS